LRVKLALAAPIRSLALRTRLSRPGGGDRRATSSELCYWFDYSPSFVMGPLLGTRRVGRLRRCPAHLLHIRRCLAIGNMPSGEMERLMPDQSIQFCPHRCVDATAFFRTNRFNSTSKRALTSWRQLRIAPRQISVIPAEAYGLEFTVTPVYFARQ